MEIPRTEHSKIDIMKTQTKAAERLYTLVLYLFIRPIGSPKKDGPFFSAQSESMPEKNQSADVVRFNN